MATQTTNLGLTLPIGTEKVKRTVINTNNQIIDTFAGTTNQAIENLNLTKLAVADANADLGNGMYYTTSASQNVPYSTGVLFNVKAGASTARRMQICTDSTHISQRFGYISNNTLTWGNWEELALKSNIEKKSETVAKASCTGTYNGVLFERTANFVKVIVHGFSSLAIGSTEICNVPSGFYSSVSGDACDIMVPSNNDGTGVRTIRFSITTTGKLTVYNYGTALTNNNAETSAFFIIG